MRYFTHVAGPSAFTWTDPPLRCNSALRRRLRKQSSPVFLLTSGVPVGRAGVTRECESGDRGAGLVKSRRDVRRDGTRYNSCKIPNPKNRNSGNFAESSSRSYGDVPPRVTSSCSFCFGTIECRCTNKRFTPAWSCSHCAARVRVAACTRCREEIRDWRISQSTKAPRWIRIAVSKTPILYWKLNSYTFLWYITCFLLLCTLFFSCLPLLDQVFNPRMSIECLRSAGALGVPQIEFQVILLRRDRGGLGEVRKTLRRERFRYLVNQLPVHDRIDVLRELLQ